MTDHNQDVDFFNTSDGKIFCQSAKSANQHFTLIWRDEWSAGKIRTKGRYYLFEDQKEFCKGDLQRPNDGHVADNGSFIVTDWLFTQELASIFYAFNRSGEKLIERRFRANLYNSAIAVDGNYAACQTAINRNSRHSETLVLFDVFHRKEIWHIKPPFWPDDYEFNGPAGELVIRSSRGTYKSCVLRIS